MFVRTGPLCPFNEATTWKVITATIWMTYLFTAARKWPLILNADLGHSRIGNSFVTSKSSIKTVMNLNLSENPMAAYKPEMN